LFFISYPFEIVVINKDKKIQVLFLINIFGNKVFSPYYKKLKIEKKILLVDEKLYFEDKSEV